MKHRILIVKIGAIGDVVMSLRMLSAIRATISDAHVTWIVGKAAVPIVKMVHGIDVVHEIDERRLFRAPFIARCYEVFRVWWKISFRKFDLVVIAHGHRYYRILTLFVLCKNKRGFCWKRRSGPLNGRYAADEYARLITGVDGPECPVLEFPRITIPKELSLEVVKRIKGSIIVAPGGAKNILREDAMRRWPLENYINLVNQLVTNGETVVVVGGTADIEIKKKFDEIKSINLIGKTSLDELIEVISLAGVIVTHDSLVMHLAVVCGQKLVALFGPTSPFERIPKQSMLTNLRNPTTVIWGGPLLPCRPCYDGVTFHHCSHNVCLSGISVDRVYKEVMSKKRYEHE